MQRHVILLTEAHEAPAYELIESLRLAGVTTLIEGLREAGAERTVSRREVERHGDLLDQQSDQTPIAVLYEVIAGADMVELQAAIEHARTFWLDTPLIACRRQSSGYQGLSLRSLDGATLKRLGFRAIADKAAQLPAILHEIEGHGATGELKLPDVVRQSPQSGSFSLPARLNSRVLRAAFELVSSLHFIGDQNGAAHTALAGLASLVNSDRWTIYLVLDAKGAAPSTLEAIAYLKAGAQAHENDESAVDASGDWRRVLAGVADVPPGSESNAARLAAAGMGVTKKKERHEFVIAVPLICGERILGVLEGVRATASFKKSEVAMLDALSRPIASALANAVRIGEAERLSQTDDLTKLHNARYLRQFLLNEIRRARRYGTSVAALFLDLDDFKRVNDAHGHLAGSHVLMEMAAVILSSIRDTDAVARYGGDEFVIVLPDTGMELAGTVAERIRSKIARHSFNGGRNLKLSLTASFGVAAFPQHASSPQQLIACADRAMYEAKAARKDCVRFSAEPAPRPRAVNEVPLSADVLEANDDKAFS
ncbi:MAG: sensor domain-containing diguanylate cyclase [Pyrinomonadaceae bacterium]|nr:sensor domain-containing diguanylate cyclase [Pyrinomonadaceae bacterium]